jgi:integrase
MRAREPFTLIKRKRKHGTVWLYRCYDEEGRRLEYSTGLDARTTSRTAARATVARLYRAGRLIPPAATRRGLTFGDFAKNFFEPNGDFAKRRAAIGRPYSGNYLEASRYALEKHLLPFFGKRRLGEITLHTVEKWTLGKLAEKNDAGEVVNASKTVRNILATLKTIMGEAQRRGLIAVNPCVGSVMPSKTPRQKRDALRPEEITALFDPEKEVEIWRGHSLVHAAALVALGTGARLGEVRALRASDVHDGWLTIARSWSVIDGEKSTKSGAPRIVPLPRQAQKVLNGLCDLQKDGLLFSLDGGKKPISSRYIQERFTQALLAAGISREEQKKRAITFHALRVTYNTYLRSANVPEAKLRAVVGHTSSELSDRYTSFKPEDLGELKIAAEGILAPKRRKG